MDERGVPSCKWDVPISHTPTKLRKYDWERNIVKTRGWNGGIFSEGEEMVLALTDSQPPHHLPKTDLVNILAWVWEGFIRSHA